MLIEDKEFTFLSTWSLLEIQDCFVMRPNKLATTVGSGEAKYYVGSSKDPLLRVFFGEKLFKIRVFMRRSELIKYMDSVKPDYSSAILTHRGGRRLPKLWATRRASLESLEHEIIWFNAEEQKVGGSRCYLKGSGDYELIRKLPLPNDSKIEINKFVSEDGKLIYEFRLLSDSSASPATRTTQAESDFYLRERIEQEIIGIISSDRTMDATERASLINARIGQGIFREDLLANCGSKCPISQITDQRILRASHIKPWRFATNSERLDPNNGLILAPTYDLLFDQGFITFEADKRIKISGQLSPETVKKLSLINGSKFIDLPLSKSEHERRLEYLKYHRDEIFKE